jgi:uncharacterized membrane protein YidH (DUF202 family)
MSEAKRALPYALGTTVVSHLSSWTLSTVTVFQTCNISVTGSVSFTRCTKGTNREEFITYHHKDVVVKQKILVVVVIIHLKNTDSTRELG